MIQNQAHRTARDEASMVKEISAAAVEPDSASASGEPIRIGVVFVHGIGKQTQSETVREFAEPIRDWATRWYRARQGLLAIDRVELSYGSPLAGTPARYELRIPAIAPHPEQTWVLAEGFWADRVSPPGLLEMIGWGLGSLGPVIRRLVINALREPWRRYGWIRDQLRAEQATPLRYLLATLGTLVDAVSQLLLAVGYGYGLLIGILLLVVLYPFALIPIPALQRFILVRLLAPILTEWIGDFEVYTSDDVLSLHVRNGVTRAIAWLAGPGRCTDVCVIGHSGGGLIAFDAVTNGALDEVGAVGKLITMGSALNQARDQEQERSTRAARRSPPAPQPAPRYAGPARAGVRWVDIWSAYDPVALGKFRGPGAEDIPATNEMNLLTDHGAYFRNDDEVISLLAQEISTPKRPRADSRFSLAQREARIQRRWERVITLVGWRLVAICLFGAVVFARSDHLDEDGQRIWAILSQLPAVQGAAGIVTGVFEGLSRAAGGVADIASSIASVSVAFRAVREFLRPNGLEPLAFAALAALFFGALFLLVYWALTFALYEPWRRSEREASVAEHLPVRTTRQRAGMWLRAIAIPALLAAFSYVVLAV